MLSLSFMKPEAHWIIMIIASSQNPDDNDWSESHRVPQKAERREHILEPDHLSSFVLLLAPLLVDHKRCIIHLDDHH